MLELNPQQQSVIVEVIRLIHRDGKHRSYALIFAMRLVRAWHNVGLYLIKDAVEPLVISVFGE